MSKPTSPEKYYQAVLKKDQRFDGQFFFGVRSTGIYCRPVCPSRTPLRKNVTFYRTAAQAQAAGFRACRRCRPESSPGSPAWSGTEAVVKRGLRMIEKGVAEGELIQISEGLGVGERQLRRLFLRHLGQSPKQILRDRQLECARDLVQKTQLPMSQIAFTSGFNSIRRFNDAFQMKFKRSPTELRRKNAGN